MSQYFTKPYEHYSENVKVELDLSNYATKADLKGALGVYTCNLAAKSDLFSLKAQVDKIDIDKLKTVPADLSKVSNVVDNDVVKKTVHDKLVTEVNATGTSRSVLKTRYNADKLGLEKKIDADKNRPDTSGLLKKADCNIDITEIEGETPNITGITTNAVFNDIAFYCCYC